ncbi:ATP-binding cassette domain-containing protein [Candidatus Babeliales bacterium]|nr:ATP-binding cassette domain-containing protein [Candidatus Babeliales bacterium]
MIFVKDVSLQYGEQILFDDISCTINKTDRIGLVGRNGAGKSTFLKLLDGKIGIDAGSIQMQKGSKIAYMPQEVVIASNKNVLDETLSALSDLYAMHDEKEKLFLKIQDDANEIDMIRYSELEHELLERNFEGKRVQAELMLEGLGFDAKKQAMGVHELSVGWRMRIVLAKLLLQDADFYLFDEPTNHLDLSAKTWFLNFLKSGDFGYLLVCHDRYFLDKVCDITFELSLGKLTIYHGNYTYYITQKEIRSQHLQQAYEQQQREIKHKQRIIDKFKAGTRASAAQSMMKALDKIEKIELDQQVKTMTLKLQVPPRAGQYVLTVKNVSFGFDRPLFDQVSFEIQREDKVALIAPNGTGKTTLFNLIAQKLPMQRGSIQLGYNVTTALFDQDQEKVLDPNKTILQEVSDSLPQVPESKIRAVLGALLFSGDDVYKFTKVLSGGERNRVAMAKVVLSNANFFLLDEPTNHLDIESKEVILQGLKSFEGTILFVSHDQDFVNRLATKIIELHEHGVYCFDGNYDAYLAFKAAKQKSSDKELHQASSHAVKKEVVNKKEQFELQKKVKNITNRIAQAEKRLSELLHKMGSVVYESVEYSTLNTEFEKIQIGIEVSKKELIQVQSKLDAL